MRTISCLSLILRPSVLASLLAVVGLAVASAGCADQEDVSPAPITLAVVPNAESAALLQAVAEDPQLREAVHLLPMASGHRCLQAVIAGQADLATVTEAPIVRSVLDGESLRVLATLSWSRRSQSILADGRRGIARVRDLAGERVGLQAGSNASYYLHAMLTYHGVDPDTVAEVPMTVEQTATALIEGTIAAGVLWSPHFEQASQALGADAVELHEPAAYAMSWNLVARKDRDLPAATMDRLLRRVLVASGAISAGLPAPALQRLAETCRLEPSDFARRLEAVQLDPRLDQALLLLMEDHAQWLGIRPESPAIVALYEALDPSLLDLVDAGRSTLIR